MATSVWMTPGYPSGRIVFLPTGAQATIGGAGAVGSVESQRQADLNPAAIVFTTSGSQGGTPTAESVQPGLNPYAGATSGSAPVLNTPVAAGVLMSYSQQGTGAPNPGAGAGAGGTTTLPFASTVIIGQTPGLQNDIAAGNVVVVSG